MKAYVIPETGPLEVLDLPDDGSSGLAILQAAVKGSSEGSSFIEALPYCFDQPEHNRVTVYVNEEGKYNGCQPNMAATDVMLGTIQFGDVIMGPMVITGFDPATGATVDLPKIPRKVVTVMRESGRRFSPEALAFT